MLEQLSQCKRCSSGLASSQSLILQTIWSLEDACEIHQQLMKRGETTTTDRRALEIDAIFISRNIRHALKNLFELHDLLVRRQFGTEDDTSPYSLAEKNAIPSIETLASLRRPILDDPRSLFNRFKIRSKHSHLHSLLNTNADASRVFGDCSSQKLNTSRQQKPKVRKGSTSKDCWITEHGLDESALAAISEFLGTKIPPIVLDVELKGDSGDPINMNVRISDTSFWPQYQIHGMTREEPIAFTEMVQSQTQNSALLLCEDLQPFISNPQRISLTDTLRQVRQFFEREWETKPDGVSQAIIECLETCERDFFLVRDQTTDSIWNVEHQEHRIEVFEASDVGIMYRQKCVCVEDALHGLDVYCPRNMSFEASDEDEELEWDEDLGEWAVKKKARPTSLASESDGSEEENAYDAEAERLEKEKERAEIKDKAIAEINEMVGLDNVKEHLLKIIARIETSKRQGADLKEERFGTVFIGNPGTGKTTVARNYTKFLSAAGVVGNGFTETSGVYLADGGISRVKSYIEDISYSGGVLFVDDAHHLLSYSGGRKVMDFMMQEMERKRGKVVFLFAGNEKGMRNVLGHGTGTSILLPYVLNFKDYSDNELLQMMGSYIKKKFDGKMEVEGGFDGLYMRIAARRVARDRDTPQFGNARAVENALARIWERQSARLAKIRKVKEDLKAAEEEIAEGQAKKTDKKASKDVKQTDSNDKETPESTARPDKADVEIVNTEDTTKNEDPATEEKLIDKSEADTRPEDAAKKNQEDTEGSDSAAKESEQNEQKEGKEEVDPADYIFTKEDILGQDPSTAILDSPAWQKIRKLTGLQAVKRSILNLFEVVKSNYQRELEEKPLLKLSLNRLFLGPPGTGKTVVAKLYAQILVEIGALSKGEVIIRNPSDLIGQYIGDSEANTKAALTAAMGNVLVIGEAHMMYTGSSDSTGNESDCYRQAMIDTIVAEVQSVPGEDRAVLLLGYGDKMQDMLQNTNPGLSRRFPITDAFWFENFSLPELESILRTKLEEHVLEATPEAIKVAMDVLDKARSRLNFGNGGEVENLISKAKTNHQGRISHLPSSQRPNKWIFEPQDFDPEYDRGKTATLNLQKLFGDVVGCEDIVKKLEMYQNVSQTMKSRNMDPKSYIPTNFVFKGPPGTGKTTTARKVAQVYYDMGFLSEVSVVECSASDLVGKYIGHSGPKTTKVLEKALGKVLFIDEAYRLASGNDGNSFTSEVVSELVDLLTKPRFHGNLIVILAGYENEMNHLLSINPGLASRFPNEIHFTCLSPTHSLKVLKMKLEQAGIAIPIVNEPKSMEYKNLVRLMGLLAGTPLWGNARDVETLAKRLCMLVLGSAVGGGELECSTQIVTAAMEAMLQERRARAVQGQKI